MSQQTKRILVPVGFSEQSILALEHAVHLAKITNAEIVLLSVIEDAGLFARLFGSEAKKQEEKLKKETIKRLDELIAQYGASGVRLSQMTANGTVHEEIANVAKMLDVMLVVMGTNGKPNNFKSSIIGSNAYRVVNTVQPPVITINGGVVPGDYNRIIFPLVLDRRSREKVGTTLHYARLFDSEVRIVGVAKNKEEAKKLNANLVQTINFIKEKGVKVTGEIIHEEGTGTAETTLKYAEKEKGDLIVIMEEGEGRGLRIFSSDVEKIIYNAPMPVMSVTPSKVHYEAQFINM